jgi:hypothetical protein
MASVGPQIHSRRSPSTPSFSGAGALPSPPPRAYITRRRHALPHVFRFNGCWSSFRSLLFAFRRFHSFPRSHPSRFPRTGHPLTLHAHPLDAHASNSASLCVLLARISLIVVSLQSLSRTALNVSLLRYIAFVLRLLVCLVPSHGGHGHVYQKALRAKVEEDIFALISRILTHVHPSPTNIPTLPRLFPCRLARRLSSTMLRVAYLYRCL